MNVAGEKLTGLPSAIADVMKSSRNSGLKMERDEVKQTFAQDVIVFGSAQLSINVKRKDLKETKSPPKIMPPSPDGAEEPDSGPPGLSLDLDTTEYARRTASVAPLDSLGATSDQPNEEGEPAKAEKPAKEPAKPGAEGAEKKAEKPAAPAAPKSDVKTVVRQAKSWSQRTQADFAKGTFSGVSASSENKLELAPTLRKLAETPEQFVWCAAPAPDGIYAGTGDSGKIYLVKDNGEAKVFYETGELEVHALAIDSKGGIYAATSPRGKVFKISPDGKGELIFKADEKYVLALAIDQQDNLYAGVGDAGKIYKIPPGGKGARFAEVGEQQILSLHWDVHGWLVAGTGINGVVYRIDKSGKATPIFDAPEDSVSSVVTDGDGNVFAGTSPKGGVYKITPDGRSKAVYTKATRVLSMACDSHNNVYAVSNTTLVKITPTDAVIQLDSSQDKVQFLSLVYNEKTGALYAGTGNIGAVYLSKCCDVMGQFESAVHDAEMVSKWGRIKWAAATSEKTSIDVQTRTGNVATPDKTWSEWSAPYTSSSGEQIAGDPARYIQYRLTLRTSDEAVSPRVSSVTITYLTPNGKPTLALAAPAGGAAWAGKETIKWTGSDPDKDTLTYDVYYSKDGKEWKTLVGGLGGTENGAGGPTNKKTEEEITTKVKSELEKSKDVPEDMKKEVLKEAPKETGAEAATAARPGAPEAASSKTSHTWNTSEVEDGAYTVKVVASDKASNAADPLTAEAISEPFVVCNAPPKVTLYAKKLGLKGTASAAIEGEASSKLVEVVGVQYRVDGGSWMAAAAKDGLFDSPHEAFALTTGNLSVGDHKVEVQAVDAAGNAASETAEVKVTEEKK